LECAPAGGQVGLEDFIPLRGSWRMEATTKRRSHGVAFKRQVAEEFITGETLHGLSKRRDISRQLIRIWFGKFEAGALDDDVQAADLIQEYEAKIVALERWSADKRWRSSCKRGLRSMHPSREVRTPPSLPARWHLRQQGVRVDGSGTLHLL
jgi:transposase